MSSLPDIDAAMQTFEKLNPLPMNCVRFNDTYVGDEPNSQVIKEYVAKWKGYKQHALIAIERETLLLNEIERLKQEAIARVKACERSIALAKNHGVLALQVASKIQASLKPELLESELEANQILTNENLHLHEIVDRLISHFKSKNQVDLLESIKLRTGYAGKPQQWKYGFDLAFEECMAKVQYLINGLIKENLLTTSIKSDKDHPDHEILVLMMVNDQEYPSIGFFCHEKMKWCHLKTLTYFDADEYVLGWCEIPESLYSQRKQNGSDHESTLD